MRPSGHLNPHSARGLVPHDEPAPIFEAALVVEVWSPSTGDYDVDEKLPEYQARGDRRI